jgi:hypothetical protein
MRSAIPSPWASVTSQLQKASRGPIRRFLKSKRFYFFRGWGLLQFSAFPEKDAQDYGVLLGLWQLIKAPKPLEWMAQARFRVC